MNLNSKQPIDLLSQNSDDEIMILKKKLRKAMKKSKDSNDKYSVRAEKIRKIISKREQK